MKRRAFLGFLGGAAAAGPAAVQNVAAEMSLSSLAVQGASIAPTSGGWLNASDNKSWAKDALKRLVGKSARQIAKEKRDTQIYQLDADVAALRSVTIGAKMRMQKALTYERSQSREEEHLRGILAGWWE